MLTFHQKISNEVKRYLNLITSSSDYYKVKYAFLRPVISSLTINQLLPTEFELVIETIRPGIIIGKSGETINQLKIDIKNWLDIFCVENNYDRINIEIRLVELKPFELFKENQSNNKNYQNGEGLA